MKFGPYIMSSLTQLFWGSSAARHRKSRTYAVCFILFSFLFTSQLSAQCVVSCKSSLNVSLGLNGESVMTPGILLVDPDCDPADFTVSISDGQGNNYGNTVSCANIGQTLTALVIQTSTGNACATTLSIFDYLPPFLTCQDTTIICVASTEPADLGFPTVSDNCSDLNSADLTYTDQVFDLACFTAHNGDSITTRIERTWSVEDEYGNRNTCVQNIYLRRATIADIVYPLDRNGYDAPVLDCQEDPFDLSVVGEPMIDGGRIDVNGYCEFVISYSDQIVPVCSPAGYTIIRTWTVIDWCADDFDLHAQLIKVKDQTAPVLTCPADITVGTNVDNCSASVLLPTASATDDCSSFSITPSWAFGTGQGPYSDIPMGIHTVTYTATDACGNSSTCTMRVQVIDNVPPVPVCDATTVIDLTSNGTGYVNATSFNDGSNDNCTIDEVLISRDGINFSAGIFFDCNDLAQSPLSLTLRVYDLARNFNDCSVTAIIEDKLAPILVCPATANLSCEEDYLDLALAGQPLVQDNCEIDTVYFSDNVQLNTCNVGQVIRTWTVEDKYGNSTSCIQWIYLEDNTPVQVNSFPSNYTTNICGINLDPTLTGSPVVSNDDCEFLYIGFTDDTLAIAYPACFVINRKWEIIDWCNHDPNANPITGYWTHTQIITVNDQVDPILQSPADITVGSFSATCGGAFVSLPDALATDCSPNVSIINNSAHADQNGANASGFYPVGNHLVFFEAQDGCGNTAYGSVNITVADSLAPQAICLDGLSLSIGVGGTVDLLPGMLDAGSSDNCTAAEDLILSVSPATFTCDDLGPNQVTLRVEDANGNIGLCVATVDIQNNMGICAAVSLGGGIEKENGVPISNVEVTLSGGSEITYITGSNGQYLFQNLEIGNNYSVEPLRLDLPDNGVSTIDLILVSRHMLSLLPITSPYKLIAADVDNNGFVNTFDIIQMQKVILFIDTIFPKSPSWRFIDADFNFANPANPFASPFPEIIQWNSVQEDILDADFVAIKMGDVNQNADPFLQQQEGTSRESQEPLKLTTVAENFAADETLQVPVTINQQEDLLGFQFTFSYDPAVLELTEMIFTEEAEAMGLGVNNFGLNIGKEGLVTASWFSARGVDVAEGTALFDLKFKAKQAGRLSDHFELNSQLVAAEAYGERVGIIEVELGFLPAEEKEVPQDLAADWMVKNYPNPFVDQTTVSFMMETGEAFTFSLFDGQGKMIMVKKGQAESGREDILIDAEEWSLAEGVYYYRLEVVGKGIKSGKMLRIGS